jgi:hypothetical protein
MLTKHCGKVLRLNGRIMSRMWGTYTTQRPLLVEASHPQRTISFFPHIIPLYHHHLTKVSIHQHVDLQERHHCRGKSPQRHTQQEHDPNHFNALRLYLTISGKRQPRSHHPKHLLKRIFLQHHRPLSRRFIRNLPLRCQSNSRRL